MFSARFLGQKHRDMRRRHAIFYIADFSSNSSFEISEMAKQNGGHFIPTAPERALPRPRVLARAPAGTMEIMVLILKCDFRVSLK